MKRVLSLLPVFFFDIPFCRFSRIISEKERQSIIAILEPGDVLLTSDKLFPMWKFVMRIAGSPHYSHTAIYEGGQYVVEATTFHPSGDGVAYTKVNDFLSGRKNICVVRPEYGSEGRKSDMFGWIRKQLGKPYDYTFKYSGSEGTYCSKLIANAMNVAGFHIATKRFLKQDVYIPDAFMETAGINVVYRKQEERMEKFLCRLPVMLSVPAFFSSTITGICVLGGSFIALIMIGWMQHLKMI
jgi:uncharacterized protein YycO